jgi:transcriptional regulator with XRE-family HTH domain
MTLQNKNTFLMTNSGAGLQTKKLRTYCNLTQEEFAGLVKSKRNSIAMIESGRNKPTFELIADMCAVFNISADYFLTEENPANYASYIRLSTGWGNKETDILNDGAGNNEHLATIEDSPEPLKKSRKEDNIKLFWKLVLQHDPALDDSYEEFRNLEGLVVYFEQYMNTAAEKINEVYAGLQNTAYNEIKNKEVYENFIKNLQFLKQNSKQLTQISEAIEKLVATDIMKLAD